jgi:hypothetical protein
LGVPEDEGDVYVAGPQHPQRLRRLGLGEPDVHARMLRPEHRRGGRDDRAQRRRERGEPYPSRAQACVRGQLVLRGVQPAEHLGGPVGQQPPGVGQPDAPSRPLDEPDAGLGLQPGQVMTYRGLCVVELPGGGRHRAVPGHRDQHPQSGDVEHVNDYR